MRWTSAGERIVVRRYNMNAAVLALALGLLGTGLRGTAQEQLPPAPIPVPDAPAPLPPDPLPLPPTPPQPAVPGSFPGAAGLDAAPVAPVPVSGFATVPRAGDKQPPNL